MKVWKLISGIFKTVLLIVLFVVQCLVLCNPMEQQVLWNDLQRLLYIGTEIDYSVLPKDINERIVIDGLLYKLAAFGMMPIGYMHDPALEKEGWPLNVVCNLKRNTLYYTSLLPKNGYEKSRQAHFHICRVKDALLPETIPNTYDMIMLSVSPEGRFMLWRPPTDSFCKDLWLLEIDGGKKLN